MVPYACNLLTRPGIQLMPLLVEMCKKSKKETNTSFQCLWASFWFLNRFAGAGEKVTAHSCGSHNSQACLKIRHSNAASPSHVYHSPERFDDRSSSLLTVISSKN